jgi:DNA-binding SARP family transcriptional activator
VAGDDIAALRVVERSHGGELLPEWTFSPWTEPLRTEIAEMHAAALSRLAELLSAAGKTDEAIRRYRILLAREPDREGWHRALMRIYVDAGERGLALRQFEQCRTALREGLGVEPSRATRDLHAALLKDD